MSVKALGDNRFLVRVYNPHGREHRKVVVGRRNADAHEADMKSKLASGRLLDPTGGKVLFRDYAAEQVATRNLRPSTQARYARALEQHIYPVLGHRPLRGIRHSDVQAFQSAMQRRFGDKHARDIVVLVRSILRAAALDGLIERNPAAGVRLDRIRPTERELPTWEQVRDTVSVSPGGTGLAVAFLALTGLRASELCGLRVDDLHLLRREARVERQLLRIDGELVESPLKTPESRRTVPLPAPLIDMAAPVLGGRVYVLGKPTAGDSLAGRVRPASRKAGASFAPHDLRHLYTNTLLEAGVPLRTVDYLAGHRPVGMTIGVYAHVTPEAVARASAALAAAWEPGSTLSSATGAP